MVIGVQDMQGDMQKGYAEDMQKDQQRACRKDMQEDMQKEEYKNYLKSYLQEMEYLKKKIQNKLAQKFSFMKKAEIAERNIGKSRELEISSGSTVSVS